MELLNTYEDKDEAEAAEKRITGKKRLASDRDDNEIIYRLFGEPTWGNFYQLEMYELRELKELVDLKKAGQPYDEAKHQSIMHGLQFLESSYSLKIPERWR